MIRVGITGQAGFVGTHLFNTLRLHSDSYVVIPFKDEVFDDKRKLEEFVSSCDTIVHLAAMNRHHNPKVIYRTNLRLVNQVIDACEKTGSTPHILFSSSTQEERDNLYGKSKREGRMLFEKWAEKHGAIFSGLVIPNVFGPFGHPYYNSVVATFSHQLTHNKIPKIDVDGVVKLIYVNELVSKIIERIAASPKGSETIRIDCQYSVKVSELLSKLNEFKALYFDKGIMPDLDRAFDRDLFNTFLCYIEHETFFPHKLELNTDERGSFVETIKLNSGGQVSFSTTKPSITRGDHFHIRKAERFAVIKGKAKIKIRRIGTDKTLSFDLDGKEPAFVDMPVWHTHNITNTGNEELYTIFWINELFNPEDPDTFYEKV